MPEESLTCCVSGGCGCGEDCDCDYECEEIEIRPCVAEFAEIMEYSLQQTPELTEDAWLKKPYWELYESLNESAKKLLVAITNGEPLWKHCVDAASYAMMIYDKEVLEDAAYEDALSDEEVEEESEEKD